MRIDCMLSSVLHVLAIIGIVLLCIIAFLLVVLLAVLFAPIRYRLYVEKEDGWKKENIHIRADISWLAGIIRVKARFFEPQILKVKVLFFTVFDLFKEKKEKRQSKKTLKRQKTDQKTEKSTVNEKPKVQNSAAEKVPPEEKAPAQDAEEETAGTEETGKSPSLRERLEKIRYTICSIYDKIKAAKETAGYYKELLQSEEFKSCLSFVTGKTGKLLRHILPKRIRGYLLFGTGQPDQTGYILGMISIIRGMRGYDKFHIEADFERQIVEGKIQCKGRIRLATVGILALQIYQKKELKELISKWKREEE